MRGGGQFVQMLGRGTWAKGITKHEGEAWTIGHDYRAYVREVHGAPRAVRSCHTLSERCRYSYVFLVALLVRMASSGLVVTAGE